MPVLLVVGAGLFGSQAAAYARRKGIETLVFDPGLEGAASSAAAGLFKEEWVSKKLRSHFQQGVSLLNELYGVGQISLTREDQSKEIMLFVSPNTILEPRPIRQRVTAVGDGWLETEGKRYQGWVYVAAGIWSEQFLPGLGLHGKAGSSFLFQGEREGRIRLIAPGRQAIRFVRNPGTTYFSDGTAAREYTQELDRQTLDQAAAMGLTDQPVKRYWGWRPYVPGGPCFRRISNRTWLATGGRKMGTLLGATFARRLVEEELLR